MNFKLIGYNESGVKIAVNKSAYTPREAIQKASLEHPGFDFLTTESGEMETADLITILNLLAVRGSND